MKEKLKNLFEKNNGYLIASKMRGSTFRYHLNKMIDSGEVSKVRHGLYMLNEFASIDQRALVSSMVPEGVFCLFSSWHYYNLTTTVPHQYHLALHRNTKLKLPAYPPIKLYRVSQKSYETGMITITENGNKFLYYNLDRTACNAVKFRNKVGEDIMWEVLKNYIKRSDKDLNRLMHYARILRIEKIITPQIKAIL